MSNLPDDKKIILTNIPGSHDSAAYNMNIFWSILAKCQDLNIMEQLKIGVRKLDIRVARNNCTFSCGLSQIVTDNDLDVICCHGICDCYYINDAGVKKNLAYKDVLLDIKEFLQDNPTETIILTVDSGRGRGNPYNNVKRAAEIFDKLVGDISINFNKNLTMGDVRGKIINVNYKTNQLSYDGKPIFNSDIEGGTGLGEIHKKFVPEFTYETFKVDGKLKVREIEEFLKIYDLTFEQAEEEFKINSMKYPFLYSLSCTGEYESIAPFPKTQADIVNPFLLNYDLQKGNYYGWLNIDFIDADVAKKIIETNFI